MCTMELFGPCPESAVFHSACVLAEQVCTIDVAVSLMIISTVGSIACDGVSKLRGQLCRKYKHNGNAEQH